jgi:hypothetical protein
MQIKIKRLETKFKLLRLNNNKPKSLILMQKARNLDIMFLGSHWGKEPSEKLKWQSIF